MGTENLYVDGFNSVNEQWTETGVTPWLNDSTANHVSTNVDEEWHEEFTFSNHVGSETLNSTTLYVEINGPSARNDFVVIDVHDGSSWTNVANQDPDGDTYVWYNYDVSALLNTWIKINAAKLRVQYQRSGSPGTQTIYVRRAYLYVDYSAAETPVLVSDGLSLNDGVGKERRFTVSDNLGAADGFPLTDRTYFLMDSTGLTDIVLKQRTLPPVPDSVSLNDLILKQRALQALQDAVGISDSVYRDKTVLLIPDALTLTDAVELLRNLSVADSLNTADYVDVDFGASQVQVSDSISLADVVGYERRLLIGDAVDLTDSLVKTRLLTIITEGITLLDGVKTDKPLLLISDVSSLTDYATREIEGSGWKGKIIGIPSPAKIMTIQTDKINKVLGIDGD